MRHRHKDIEMITVHSSSCATAMQLAIVDIFSCQFSCKRDDETRTPASQRLCELTAVVSLRQYTVSVIEQRGVKKLLTAVLHFTIGLFLFSLVTRTLCTGVEDLVGLRLFFAVHFHSVHSSFFLSFGPFTCMFTRKLSPSEVVMRHAQTRG